LVDNLTVYLPSPCLADCIRPSVRNASIQARGGVLFIDEAYQLNSNKGGAFMSEVLDEIVKCLSSEDLKGRLVTILAGYDGEIDDMLKCNPGLKSRFPRKVPFLNLNPVSVGTMLRAKLWDQFELRLDVEAEDCLPALCKKLTEAPEFGNGRDVENWSKQVSQKTSDRIYAGGDEMGCDEIIVTASDITCALKEVLSGKQPSQSKTLKTVVSPPLSTPCFQAALNTPPPPPNYNTVVNFKTADAQFTQDGREDQEDHIEPNNSFSDIPAEVLTSLQSVLDELGLNTKDGVEQLATMDLSDSQFCKLADALVAKLGMSKETAANMLKQWQAAQLDVQKEFERASKQTQLRPIWRCGVCGRADKPWIACYVAPFIVRYEEVE
jgi:hypothetical protein